MSYKSGSPSRSRRRLVSPAGTSLVVKKANGAPRSGRRAFLSLPRANRPQRTNTDPPSQTMPLEQVHTAAPGCSERGWSKPINQMPRIDSAAAGVVQALMRFHNCVADLGIANVDTHWAAGAFGAAATIVVLVV